MNKKYVSILFIFVVGFFTFSNYIFLQRVDFFADKDEAYHAEITSTIFQSLVNERGIPDYFLLDPNWPRGYHIIAALVRILFGFKFVFLTPTLFLIVLLYSTYKIGEFLKDRRVGLLSALILSFYPGIYVSSCHFDYEMAQTAMVALIMYFLIRSDRFISLRYSLLFGLLLALGLLIKQSIIFFIAGPFVIAFYYLLRPVPQNRIRLRNLLISLLFCFVLAFLGYYRMYFLHPEFIIKYGIQRFFITDISGLPCSERYRPAQLLFYLTAIKNFYIGIAGIILLIISLPYFLRKNKNLKYQLFLICWFIIPFCILSIATLKSPHYSIAYLPVFAIITAIGATCIQPKIIGRGLIIIFLALGFLSYTCCTFNLFPKTKNFLMSNSLYLSWEPWGLSFSRASNPAHLTAEYLNKTMRGKKSLVGIVYYVSDETGDRWYTAVLKSLIQLYNSKYKVIDFIIDDNQAPIHNCDFFIFIRSLSRSDNWLNYNTFLQDSIEANKARPLFWQLLLTDRPDMPPIENVVFIPREKIERLIDYFPNLKLLKAIKGESKEFLIYKNESARNLHSSNY